MRLRVSTFKECTTHLPGSLMVLFCVTIASSVLFIAYSALAAGAERFRAPDAQQNSRGCAQNAQDASVKGLAGYPPCETPSEDSLHLHSGVCIRDVQKMSVQD
eukprot:3098454-Amphidinium_carterae.1